MKFRNEKVIGILQVISGAALFGLIPILVRFGESINTPALVFFRAFFGALFIYLLIKLSGRELKKFNEEKVKLIGWSVILILAIGTYFAALKLLDIASAVLLLYSYSIFIVFLSRFWLKEKIYFHTIIALIISIVGVVLIISPSGFKFQGNAVGYLFAISAAFFSALNFVFPKKYFQNYDIHSLVFYQSIWQLPVLISFVFFNPPTFSVANLGIFASLGIFCTALSFLLVYGGSRKIPGQYVGILQTTEVIVPIVLGVLLFSEVPSPLVIIGGLLLIFGYIIIGFKESELKSNEKEFAAKEQNQL